MRRFIKCISGGESPTSCRAGGDGGGRQQGGSIDQLTRRLAPRLLQETQVVWPSAAWQGAEKLDLKEGGDGVAMGWGWGVEGTETERSVPEVGGVSEGQQCHPGTPPLPSLSRDEAKTVSGRDADGRTVEFRHRSRQLLPRICLPFIYLFSCWRDEWRGGWSRAVV